MIGRYLIEITHGPLLKRAVLAILVDAVLSFFLAPAQKVPRWKVIAEHLLIGMIVITSTHYIGTWISATFG